MVETRKFGDWPLWFVLHIADNMIIRVEEHDMRAGGVIMPEPSQSHKELFLARVNHRFFTNPTSAVAEAIEFVRDLR